MSSTTDSETESATSSSERNNPISVPTNGATYTNSMPLSGSLADTKASAAPSIPPGRTTQAQPHPAKVSAVEPENSPIAKHDMSQNATSKDTCAEAVESEDENIQEADMPESNTHDDTARPQARKKRTLPWLHGPQAQHSRGRGGIQRHTARRPYTSSNRRRKQPISMTGVGKTETLMARALGLDKSNVQKPESERKREDNDKESNQ